MTSVVAAIDRDALPWTAAIDTGVFMRGVLGERPDEVDSAICRAFCDAMIDSGRELFVAAPTVAEVARFRGERPPRRRGVITVPFCGVAAEVLGLQMPQARIHETATRTGLSRTYLKYDSMILACAIRSNAQVLVALDSDHAVMARELDFDVRHPESFRAKQGELFGR